MEPVNFFIVGCPRSGTTMLQQALNRHSEIVVPPETKFFYYFHRMPIWLRRRQLERIEVDLGINLGTHRKDTAIRDGAGDRQLFLDIMQRYADRLGASPQAVGEKTPEHTGRIARIRRLFPGSIIFFLYRDGRDVALSLSKVPWIRCHPEVAMLIWLRYYRELIMWQRVGDSGIIPICYEELARQPSNVLKQVLRHLKLGYEPQMIGRSIGADGIPERELQWKSRALKPISAERIGVHKREWTTDVIRRVEALAVKPLRELGYEVGVEPGRRSLYLQMPGLVLRGMQTVSRLPGTCLAAEAIGTWQTLWERAAEGGVRKTPLVHVGSMHHVHAVEANSPDASAERNA